MAQPALRIAPQEAIEEIESMFEQKLAQIGHLKTEIREMNLRIKLMHGRNPQLFTDETVKELAVRIGQLRKLLKETELEVQLLFRAIAFGK